MSATKAVEYERGLTLRVLIISVLMTVVAFVLNFWLMTRTAFWLFPGVLPLGTMYVILINEGLGRLNPRWRLSPQELTVLFIAFFAIGGFGYSMYAELKYGVNIIPTYVNLLGPIRALNVEPLRTYWLDKISPLWAPPRYAAEIAWVGLKPSQTIDWAAWAVPVAYWTSWFITWTTWSYLLAFMLRKQMVKVERLPFTMVLPSAYPIVWSTEPKESPSNIFNLKSTFAKIFWVAVVLGMLTTISDVVRYFIPAVPASGEFTTIPIDLTPYTRASLPGASFTGYLILPRVAVFALLGTDVLLSGTIAWFVMFVLYPLVGVKIGLLPYSPGVESDPWYYGQNVGPIRSIYAVNTGITIGIGLWVLYIARSHFKEFFTSLYNALQRKESTVEQGVSYHLVSAGFIGLTILFLLFFIISGVPAGIALLMFGVYVIMEVGNIYTMGYYAYLTDNNWVLAPLGFYSGVATGLWGTSIPNPSIEAARTSAFASFLNVRYISYNGRLLSGGFKVADMTKTRAKDALIIMVVCAVVGAITANTISVWWIHRFGLRNLSVDLPFGGLSTSYTNAAFPITPDIFLSHSIGGAIITLLIYALRMRFPWFALNPVGIAIALFSPTWYGFPNLLVALAIRWLAHKIGGAKLWETRVLPFLIGWTSGYSLNYVIVMWIAFFTRALPAGL
jgi:hypothetical protein